MHNKINAILQCMLQYFECENLEDDSLEKNIQESYYNLSKSEKEILIQTIKDTGDPYTLLLSLSLLLCNREDDNSILELLIKTVINSNLPVQEQLKYFIQCRSLIFDSFPEFRNYLISLYNRILRECLSSIHAKYEFIPYSKRNNNKVLLITNQLLSERHSPTQLVINQWYYLTKIGYEVSILIMSEGHIEPPLLWKAPSIKMLNTIDQTCRFTVNYYGYDVKGINIFFETTDLIKQLDLAMVAIRDINPAFIISMEEMNLVGDLASEFTTVVMSNFSTEFPVSASKYVIFNGKFNSEDAKKELSKDKIIFQYLTDPILAPKSEGDEETIENLRNERRLKVLIVGNRLDQELGSDFEACLNNLTKECPNILYVIVGDCDALKERIKTTAFFDHYYFTGFSNNLPGITKECDLFLNPPRSGGGYSSKIALEHGLPVITLDNCDVSYWAGSDFVYDSITSMIEDVKKSYNDRNYLMHKSQRAKDRWESFTSSEREGIQRTKEFTSKLLSIIQND